jgi:hypothetical protein
MRLGVAFHADRKWFERRSCTAASREKNINKFKTNVIAKLLIQIVNYMRLIKNEKPIGFQQPQGWRPRPYKSDKKLRETTTADSGLILFHVSEVCPGLSAVP